jgi:hypothetical protein
MNESKPLLTPPAEASVQPKQIAATGTALVRIGWILFVIGCFGVLIILSRSGNSSGPTAAFPTRATPAPAPEPAIVVARRVIPTLVAHLYEALDRGNPSDLVPILSSNTRNNLQVLDAICRPYTYRAHYIETIVERSENQYEAWVRVLFKPLEEHAYVLVFTKQGGSFLLDGIADPPDNWFGAQIAEAEEIGRNFLFALGAGKDELAERALSDKLKLSFESAAVLNQIRNMQLERVEKHEGSWVESYAGLKIRTCPYLYRKNGAYLPDLALTLLFEQVDGQLKIVGWAKDCGFFKEGATEVYDPDLEARTLKRFHLEGTATKGH